MLKNIKPVSLVIIAGDVLDAFIDGLAIGAAFSKSNSTGISTTIAVTCTDVAHKFSSYAVLVQFGFLHVQAILEKVLLAVIGFSGFYFGASISTDNGMDTIQWIFAITAAMFFYLSLVNLLPILLADKDWGLGRFMFINFFLWLGFGIMLVIALFEEKIKI